MVFKNKNASLGVLVAAIVLLAVAVLFMAPRGGVPESTEGELRAGSYAVYIGESGRDAARTLYRLFLDDPTSPPEVVTVLDREVRIRPYNQSTFLFVQNENTETRSLVGATLALPAYSDGVLSPNASLVAFPDAGKDTVWIEETATGRRTEVVPVEPSEFSTPFPVTWSADAKTLYGKTFYEGNAAPTGLWRYDLTTRAVTDLQPMASNLFDVIVYPELQVAIGIAPEDLYGEALPQDIVMVDLRTGEQTVIVQGTVRGRPAIFPRFGLSPDGASVAYSYTGGEVWLVPIGREPQPDDRISASGWLVGFSADGEHLVIEEGALRVVNLRTRETRRIESVGEVVGIFQVE